MNFPHLFENDFYAILPELYLTLSTLVLLLFGVFYSTSKKHQSPSMMQTVAWLGLFCLFCLFLIDFRPPRILKNIGPAEGFEYFYISS